MQFLIPAQKICWEQHYILECCQLRYALSVEKTQTRYITVKSIIIAKMKTHFDFHRHDVMRQLRRRRRRFVLWKKLDLIWSDDFLLWYIGTILTHSYHYWWWGQEKNGLRRGHYITSCHYYSSWKTSNVTVFRAFLLDNISVLFLIVFEACSQKWYVRLNGWWRKCIF